MQREREEYGKREREREIGHEGGREGGEAQRERQTNPRGQQSCDMNEASSFLVPQATLSA